MTRIPKESSTEFWEGEQGVEQGLAGWFLSFGLGEKYAHKESRRMLGGRCGGRGYMIMTVQQEASRSVT